MSDKTPELREPTNTFLVYINSALASCYTVRKCATKGREVNGGGDDKRERGHRPDGGGFLKAAAYKIIRQLNAEFKEGGCRTIHGRVSREYFERATSECSTEPRRGR